MIITRQQLHNLLEARDVMWPSVPGGNVLPQLGAWRNDSVIVDRTNEPPTCGTMACFGGWCAWWPTFRKQGVRSDRTGAPYVERRGGLLPNGVAQYLFGYEWLFSARGFAYADIGILKRRGERIGDHELVTRRLNYAITNAVVRR